MNTLEQIYQQDTSCVGYLKGYIDYTRRLLESLDLAMVEAVVDALACAYRQGNTIYIVGNGGSASTASHFATDLSYGARGPGRPLIRAMSLTDNNSVLTALSNDHGYQEVFLRQLEVHLREGDVLVAISASGNSENAIRAVELADQRGGVTVGLVGFDGGRLKERCQLCIHIPSQQGDYAPVEDAHLAITHMIATFLGLRLRGA